MKIREGVYCLSGVRRENPFSKVSKDARGAVEVDGDSGRIISGSEMGG